MENTIMWPERLIRSQYLTGPVWQRLTVSPSLVTVAQAYTDAVLTDGSFEQRVRQTSRGKTPRTVSGLTPVLGT